MGEPAGTIFTTLLFMAAFLGSGAYAVLSMADFRAARRGFWATALSFATIGLVLGIMTTWPLSIRIAVCAAFMAVSGGGLIWILDYLKVRETLGIAETATPNISFQKFALFWVETEKDVYYLGVIVKLFDLDTKPYLIKGITIDRVSWKLIPRGGYLLRRYTEFHDHVEIIEDNYIKGGDVGYFKKLLPIRVEMTVQGGLTPDFMLLSRWNLVFDDKNVPIKTDFYAPYDNFISQQEWDDLLKPKSKIDVNDLQYKRLPDTIDQPVLKAEPSLALSNFLAQIDHTKLQITFSIENSGPAIARAIKIEMQAGIGPIPAPPQGTPAQNVVAFPDDLAPGKHAEQTIEIQLSDTILETIHGKAFGCIASGNVIFNDGVSIPFDYWVLRKPGDDLVKPTPMVRRPPFLKPPANN